MPCYLFLSCYSVSSVYVFTGCIVFYPAKDHNLLGYLPIFGHKDCFQCFINIKNIVINTFLQIEISSSLYFLKPDFQKWNYWVKSYKLFLTFATLPNCFSKSLYKLTMLRLAILENSIFIAPIRFQDSKYILKPVH